MEENEKDDAEKQQEEKKPVQEQGKAPDKKVEGQKKEGMIRVENVKFYQKPKEPSPEKMKKDSEKFMELIKKAGSKEPPSRSPVEERGAFGAKEKFSFDNAAPSEARVKTGVAGLDELIEGGFERDSTIIIVGSAGTGKTILGLQFLYKGITEYNEPGVFISFSEDKESLYRHAFQFGWNFKKLEEEGKFRLFMFRPHQMAKILEEGGGIVRDALRLMKAKRIVVDSVTIYGLLFKNEYERRDKILEFFNYLKKWDVTAIVVSEEQPKNIETEEGSIGFIADAIISLYYKHDEEKGIRIHSLEILKMRGTKHTSKVCAMNFEKEGIRVYPDVEIF